MKCLHHCPAVLLAACGLAAALQGASARGEPLRVPVTRDTWFSNAGKEADCNLGGANRLKLKSNQEMSLIDIDPKPLRGRVIQRATLHVRLYGNEILHRVTVGSFASPWVEGTSPGYAPQQGSSTFNAQRHPDVPWAFPLSDLTAVMLAQGGSLWRMGDATPPDRQNWQQVPVDPLIVAARVAGISYGLFLFDDTGCEWTRQGESVSFYPFPNRFVHSRESGTSNAPYLMVSLGEADNQPPSAPGGLAAEVTGLPAGEAIVSWTTPEDRGPAGTIGFLVEADGKPVPRYLIPPAGEPGRPVSMRLRDLGLAAGDHVKLAIKAVDAAGNVSAAATRSFQVSAKVPKPLPGKPPRPPRTPGPLPKLGGAEVAILDALDKVHPVSGAMTPQQAPGYLAANHLWRAGEKRIRLAAARNEFIAFQVAFHGTVRGVKPQLAFEPDGRKIKIEFARYRYVASENGPLPDPVVPLDGPFDVPAAGEKIARQAHGSLLCEVYVPHDAATGAHRGTLTLRTDTDTLKIDVLLWVWDFTLPDVLSFLPEMNCYELPAGQRDYYRLAHLHRTVLNRVPYSHRGRVDEGCAPKWDGRQLDWSDWDQRFGAYFDGSAFADLPRKAIPIEGFYLPLHENWPVAIETYYNGDYWADRAFRRGYRETLVEVTRQMAEHFSAQGWNRTLFQCFLNNKNMYKRSGWSHASSPWLLDEPADFQDFWALRYFGEVFQEGIARAGRKATLLYRCDISRPEWQRDALDHVLDYNVVGSGAFRRYHRLVMDRKQRCGQIVLAYGSTNQIEDSNMQPVGWCLDTWTLGGDGVLPWQTIGRENSWTQADKLSLFYPGDVVGLRLPVPSIRLKAYRRGQQDVEYLTLLTQSLGEPAWAVGQSVRKALRLAAGKDDADAVDYAKLLPQDVWALRIQVARALSAMAPAPKRQLVDFRCPPRDPAAAPAAYVTGFSGASQPAAPDETPPLEPTVVRVLQGRDVVRDAIIDPDFPEKSFGSVARDNRLVRGERCNALLVRFDLTRLRLPPNAKVVKATVGFYVWDPSPGGNAKVCAFGLKTAWDEATATWQKPAGGGRWKGGETFQFGVDTLPPGRHVVVLPDQGGDTVDPPLEYQLDVTPLVRDWLAGKTENYGVAIAPVIDLAIDDGRHARMQVLTSEHSQKRYTPKLTIGLR